ncbi:hypothetical protein [Streptomyces sp. N35]|uniref:hypothetical protein n=1 Tax=Streptomyces sp. N35 TaxID=2795730 RepID=UPI0018F463CE|nr:hypothetical protein [Streptomyces sp. N35]
MPVIINAHQLGRLLDRTVEHIGDEFEERLYGIRLETDDTFLHVIASDRATLAVARYRHQQQDGTPLAHTIPGSALTPLREWITAQHGSAPVTIAAHDDTARLRFTAPSSDLGIAVTPGLEFFDWRAVVRRILEQPAASDPFPVLDMRLLKRFHSTGDTVRFKITGDRQAVQIVAEDFIGAQIPMTERRAAAFAQTIPSTVDDMWSNWQQTLSAAEPVTLHDAIPATEDRPSWEDSADFTDTTGELLKQVLRNTHTLVEGDDDSMKLRTARAVNGVMAWQAYRFLVALHTADPRLAVNLLAETADELDCGEIGLMAWDAAEQAGHEPDAWQAEFEAKHAVRPAVAADA